MTYNAHNLVSRDCRRKTRFSAEAQSIVSLQIETCRERALGISVKLSIKVLTRQRKEVVSPHHLASHKHNILILAALALEMLDRGARDAFTRLASS